MRKENYTDEQLKVLSELERARNTALDLLLRNARQAFDAVVSLPHTNEPVVHGCNKNMLQCAEEMLEAAQPLFCNLRANDLVRTGCRGAQ